MIKNIKNSILSLFISIILSICLSCSESNNIDEKKNFSETSAFQTNAFQKNTLENKPEKWHSHNQKIMGTTLSISIFSREENASKIFLEVINEISRIENKYSPYIETSVVYQINHRDTQDLKIDEETGYLLNFSKSISKITNGGFDITYQSLGYLYDFRKNKIPTPNEVKNLQPYINFKSFSINESKKTIHFDSPNIKINLGGFVKGYAADKSIEILKKNHIINGSVSIGGDSKIIGLRPEKGNKKWTIGIKDPDKSNSAIEIIKLTNSAISTSGDYERFFYDENNNKIHHIINPNTGKPAKEVKSVTIIGKDAIQTDALSTGIFILGTQKGLELINSIDGIEAIIVDKNRNIYKSDGAVNFE